MKEIDKMISGHLYRVSDGELVKHLSNAKDLCDEFNTKIKARYVLFLFFYLEVCDRTIFVY